MLHHGFMLTLRAVSSCMQAPSSACPPAAHASPSYELDAELDGLLDEALGLSPGPSPQHYGSATDFTASPASCHTAFHSDQEGHEDYSPTHSPDPDDRQPSGWANTAQDPGVSCLPPASTLQRLHSGRAPLEVMPREVLMRVWSFLSAEDLTSCARVSRALAHLASEPVLWRRLYCARWGRGQGQRAPANWKVGLHNDGGP